MSATVLPLDCDRHCAIQTLLPWYASGRLDADDRLEVESHLATCVACRGELDWERKMLTAQSAMGDRRADPEAGLARLHWRIQAGHGIARARPRWRWHLRANVLQWLAAIQFACIAVLATAVFLLRNPPAPFHALGAGGAVAANLVARFRADATEQDIRHALQEAGARLVDGPTVTDAYLLRVPAGREAVALARLRARAVVVLANSLDGASGP